MEKKRWRHEEARTHQHQRALSRAAKASTLGELTSALAHELTQPLTSISNFINGCIRRLQANKTKKNSELLSVLKQAAQEAQRAEKVIHRIKDLARQGKLQFENVGLNEIIHVALELINKEHPRSEVEIHMEGKPISFRVCVDRIQIEQVLLNLLRNAVEAIESANTHNPKIWITRFQSETGRVTVRIVDNGPGIPAKNVSKIFEPSFTTKTKGLGMGLAICRTIIEAHGGHLDTCNHKNKGACFEFTLPLVRSLPAANKRGQDNA